MKHTHLILLLTAALFAACAHKPKTAPSSDTYICLEGDIKDLGENLVFYIEGDGSGFFFSKDDSTDVRKIAYYDVTKEHGTKYALFDIPATEGHESESILFELTSGTDDSFEKDYSVRMANKQYSLKFAGGYKDLIANICNGDNPQKEGEFYTAEQYEEYFEDKQKTSYLSPDLKAEGLHGQVVQMVWTNGKQKRTCRYNEQGTLIYDSDIPLSVGYGSSLTGYPTRNDIGRLTEISVMGNQNEEAFPLYNISYEYYSNGMLNRKSVDGCVDGSDFSNYSFDETGNLTEYSYGTSEHFGLVKYTGKCQTSEFDAHGNWTKCELTGTKTVEEYNYDEDGDEDPAPKVTIYKSTITRSLIYADDPQAASTASKYANCTGEKFVTPKAARR